MARQEVTMLSQNNLKVLQGSEVSVQRPTLSLYLDVDQSKSLNRNREFEATLAGLLRSIEERISDQEAECELFRDEARRVSSFVNSYKSHGKTLVVFSDQGSNLFWARTLHVPVRESAVWEPGPFLRPLIEALDEYETYAVALADRERARLFLGRMGEMEEFADLWGPDGGARKTTGTDHAQSKENFQRHAEEHMLSHVHQVVQLMLETDQRKPFDRLILAGSTLVRAQIGLALPKRLRRKVVASLQLPVDASRQEVLDAVLQIEQETERKEEVRTVEALLTSASKGQEAVLGLAGTLAAASQGQIHKLIYADNFAADRAGCLNCGAPQQGGESRCARCGEELQPPARLLDQIVERVGRTGGKIETVKDKAAQLMNEKDGGIGAFLRF
jgi:hypothetical protein